MKTVTKIRGIDNRSRRTCDSHWWRLTNCRLPLAVNVRESSSMMLDARQRSTCLTGWRNYAGTPVISTGGSTTSKHTDGPCCWRLKTRWPHSSSTWGTWRRAWSGIFSDFVPTDADSQVQSEKKTKRERWLALAVCEEGTRGQLQTVNCTDE